MVERMLMPNPRPMARLGREFGVPNATLHRWRNLATVGRMSGSDDKPTPAEPPQEWSAEQKLAIVLEAAAIPDAELGEFLRRKGVHEAQLKEWRDAAIGGLSGSKRPDRKEATSDARRIRELERELKRKDKALAETAALLVLKKKVQEIWGDEDDDTDPKNDE